MRAAGLDWYEQGDVWRLLAEHRNDVPTARTGDLSQVQRLHDATRHLMTISARPLCAAGKPMHGFDGWIDAFEAAGQALAHLNRHGDLRRGLRAVLAHHLIFHANRAGLSLTDQATIAHMALNNVFTGGEHGHTTNQEGLTVTAAATADDMTNASSLRNALTDQLVTRGAITSSVVEDAFRSVPRHLFLPGVDTEAAYADAPIYTKYSGDGTQISAASQPGIVAVMLAQLDAQPGHRVLEAGAGTGYNAALLGAVVGDNGYVTTLDIDDDIVDGARRHLHAAGSANVEALVGDGALGYPANAPYDRVIATVGAWEVPTAWLDQLAPDGRLVVPLRLAGAASRSIAFERGEDGWTSVGSELAVFMPLRGIGDDARTEVSIDADVILQTHKDQPVDGSALAEC
ncbi:methyltransferase, FxLD system [Luedemannella flava]